MKTQVFEKDRKLNKRQQLDKALEGGEAARSHDWQEGHRSRDNLTAKRKKCGLYIQQVDKPEVFDEEITQPCWSEARPVLENSMSLIKSRMLEWRGFAWGAKVLKTLEV